MKLGLAVAAAAFFCAMPASAENQRCEQGCTYDPENFPDGYPFDFTISSSRAPGVVWQVRFESDDPNARVFLPTPGEVFIYTSRRTETGIEEDAFSSFDRSIVGFSFNQIARPGLITGFYRFDRPFDRCSEPGPIGEICARSFDLIGNGRSIDFRANAPVRFFFSETAMVPEPATWAMMIGGFGLVGAAARRRARVAFA